MANKTGIEWTDSTWSPIRVRVKADAVQIARDKGYTSLIQIAEKMAGRVGPHCEHVSPGCENCYAATNNHRCLPANGTGLPYDRRSRDLVEAFVDEKILLQPLKWKPITESVTRPDGGIDFTVRPRRIFVENQSDLFGEWVTDEMLDRVFAVMAMCPQHTFQVLSKRPARMLAYLNGAAGRLADVIESMRFDEPRRAVGPLPHLMGGETWFPLANVHLGVSVENQATADERIPLLLQTPAAVRFISAEPLLGPVNLDGCIVETQEYEFSTETWRKSALDDSDIWHSDDGDVSDGPQYPKLDWAICGGESGPGARPMHPDWARSLRDQCQAAGVPFFFKQWGEWLPFVQREAQIRNSVAYPHNEYAWKVGKKTAGSLLDGVEWKQFPEARE